MDPPEQIGIFRDVPDSEAFDICFIDLKTRLRQIVCPFFLAGIGKIAEDQFRFFRLHPVKFDQSGKKFAEIY